METKMTEKFWNRLSKNYDKNAKDKSFVLITNKTKKHLTPNHVILDFACATGLYSFEFAPFVKNIQAFDTSSGMIQVAKNKLGKLPIRNIVFFNATIFDERFEEGSYDAILAFNILLYFKDIKKVLDRVHKLLKPNGLIITSTACLKEKRTFMGVFSSCVIYFLKKLKILPYIKFITIAELKNHFTNDKFKIIETDIIIDKPATEYYIIAKKQ